MIFFLAMSLEIGWASASAIIGSVIAICGFLYKIRTRPPVAHKDMPRLWSQVGNLEKRQGIMDQKITTLELRDAEDRANLREMEKDVQASLDKLEAKVERILQLLLERK